MNKDFKKINNLLCDLKSEYAVSYSMGGLDPNQPITERDIVSEIYCRLRSKLRETGLSVHTEIKPAPSVSSVPEVLKKLPKIDVAILHDINGRSWLEEAKKLQGKYQKGHIESRFSSVPIAFFHTAIEVKIQSNPRDAIKDIDTLFQIHKKNKGCNCFLVLLNARGNIEDHFKISEYSKGKGIPFIEHTTDKHE